MRWLQLRFHFDPTTIRLQFDRAENYTHSTKAESSSINQSIIYLLIKMYEIHKYNSTSKTEQDSKAHWGSNSCP